MLRLHEGDQLLGLGRRDHLGLHAEVATPGVGHPEPVEAVGVVGEHDLAGEVDAARLTGALLEVLVELDRVALEGGDVGVAVDRVHAAGGVPCGAGGEVPAFEQHHIGPAGLG